MEHKIEYRDPNWFPEVYVDIKPVTEGVWLIYIDLFDRFDEPFWIKSSDDWEYLYFMNADNDLIFCVKFKPEKDGILIGSLCKKTYHGTYYEHEAYSRIMRVE